MCGIGILLIFKIFEVVWTVKMVSILIKMSKY